MLPSRWAKRLKTQESVQRSLCRIGFLLLAVLPTLFVMSSWLWSITPWSRYWTVRTWERTISLNMGVDVHIVSIENTAPNRCRLHGVTLKHPETADSIATIPSIEFHRSNATWMLRLQSPVIELSQASNFVQAIHQRCLCQPNLAFPPMTCSIRELTLMNDAEASEPIYLESRFQCNTNMSSLQIRFDLAKNLATNNDAQSASFVVERLHDAIAPRTSWLLETHGLEVPCKVLAAFQSVASQLGPNATFQGDLHWEQDNTNWHASLAGIFQKIRWNAASDAMSIAMPKNGLIRVEAAQVANGRFVQADGLVTSESGSQIDLGHWLSASGLMSLPSAVQAASHTTSPGSSR